MLALGPPVSEPPPTSGNLLTILLGVTAFSVVGILVAVWAIRGIRHLLSRSPDDAQPLPRGGDREK